MAIELLQDLPCAVLRAVIDDDQFFLDSGDVDGEHPADDFADGGLLVVGRHDDGETGVPCCIAHGQGLPAGPGTPARRFKSARSANSDVNAPTTLDGWCGARKGRRTASPIIIVQLDRSWLKMGAGMNNCDDPGDSSSAEDRELSRLKIAILGSRGIPAIIGGFETLAEQVGTRLAARGRERHGLL